MEQISVFDYIETACAVLDENASGFSHAADKLVEFLEAAFGNVDATVGVASRIKTRDSLKEKILRNHLYKDCPAERLVFEMHDIIGVRLDCRFFKDEEFLYLTLKKLFNVDVGDGYYSPTGKKAIKLKLDTPQPEKQRNGFNIYRIDGCITYAGEVYNFELQIKSLVNSFWSEIEHKLIYKNIRFSPSDTLMKDLLNSIHESLTGVDHQLNLIFDRFANNALDNQHSQLESMLALGINEIYSAIIKAHTGISVSISEYSEAVVVYLLSSSSSYMRNAEGTPFAQKVRNDLGISAPQPAADGTNYGGMLISLMEWMRNVDYGTIAIGERLELKMPENADARVARVFIDNVNDDFYLNAFFHIFFSLERGDNACDFADYIRYYTERILGGKTEEQRERTLAALEATPAHKLPLETTILRLMNTI